MKAHRLRAPSTDGGLLATPSLDEIGPLLDDNIQRLGAWDYDFQGRPVGELRDQVRRELTAAARRFLNAHDIVVSTERTDGLAGDSGPLIVTGHQPELFHPGVWVKNFAAAALARERGGVALNLIVDDDIPKSASIRIPRVENGRTSLRRVEFDRWEGEAPYEELPVRDEALFASFGERVERSLQGLIADPLIRDYWPEVAHYRASGFSLGRRLALGRRRLEGSWGVSNLEIPLSWMCRTEGFYWFACHLLAHLPRFLRIHNQALDEYRALYGIRSKNHPVTALRRRDDWLEAPFWIWRAGGNRRRSLFVRRAERSMFLRIADEDEPFLELPLAEGLDARAAVERLRELETTSIRLRTRALTTTMFLRTLFADLFIHGIGGAKYDELGDAIIAGFYGIAPPTYMTLSMTLWLGLGADPGARAGLTHVERALRDVEYKPELWLADCASDPALAGLLDAKQAALDLPHESHPERLRRFRAIRAATESLRPYVRATKDDLLHKRDALRESVHRDAVARSREYSLVLHSRSKLRSAFAGLERGPKVSPGSEP